MALRWVVLWVLSMLVTPLTGTLAGEEPSAEKGRRFRFEASGGVSVPWQPEALREHWKPGVSAGIGWGLQFSEMEVVLLADIQTFTFKREEFERDLGLSGVKIRGGRVSYLSATFNFRSLTVTGVGKSTPYALGGLGVHHAMVQDFQVENVEIPVLMENSTRLALQVGAGLEFPGSGGAGPFVEARAIFGLHISGEGSNTPRQSLVIRAGIRERH